MDPRYTPEPSQHGQISPYQVDPLQLPRNAYEQDDDTQSIVTKDGDPKQKFIISHDLNASAILKLVALILLVTAHACILGFFLSPTADSSTSLIGEDQFIFNRYFSMKSTHAHRLNTHIPQYVGKPDYALNTYFGVPLVKIPQFWWSWAFVTPAYNDDHNPSIYNVGSSLIPKEARNRYSACIAQKNSRSFSSKCVLEELHGTVLLEHGTSMSILSEISPAIYFVTLLSILLLSSANQVSIAIMSLQQYVTIKCMGECCDSNKIICGYSLERFVRKLLYFVIFLVYVTGILNGFSSSPLMQKTVWFDQNVYFNILPHMPSIFISVVSILLYSYHFYSVKYNKQPWIGIEDDGIENENMKDEDVATATLVMDAQDDGSNMELLPLQENAFMSTAPGNVIRMDEPNENGEAGPRSPKQRRTFGSSCTNCHIALPFENYMQTTAQTVKRIKSLCIGPPASEASILGSFTAFLGGIGSIGMMRGSIQEVQLQLVIAALFGFAVLEIATYKLTSFFNYFLQVINFNDGSDEKHDMQNMKRTFFIGILFIRFVTLLLQFFIIIVYADIRNDLKLENSALSELVLVLIAFFFAMKLVTWGISIYAHVNMPTANEEKNKSSKAPAWLIMSVLDFVEENFYCFLLFLLLLIGVALQVTQNHDNLETKLMELEKSQFVSMSLMKDIPDYDNADCPNNFISSDLLLATIRQEHYKMLPVTEDEWETNVHVVGSTSDVDPVDLKIFYWTRGWKLRNVNKNNAGLMPPTAWFCSNGFEFTWNACASQRELAQQNLPIRFVDGLGGQDGAIYKHLTYNRQIHVPGAGSSTDVRTVTCNGIELTGVKLGLQTVDEAIWTEEDKQYCMWY